MGRIRDLVLRSQLGQWDTVEKRQLEDAFDLRYCNVGGPHSEVLENQHDNRWRRKCTIIPCYTAGADPHLKKFFRQRRRAGQPASGKSADSVAQRKTGGRTQQQPRRGHGLPTSFILGTEQVLDLKRFFYGNSSATVLCADGAGSKVRVLNASCDVVFVYRRGVEKVNNHRRLHQRGLLEPASSARVLRTLLYLGCDDYVDWPTYLLICTTDLGRDSEYKKLLRLKDAHERHLASNVITNEADFARLLAHLQHAAAEDMPVTSFFQNGDFYQSRGRFDSFPEAFLALSQFFTQVYVARARGRGPKMDLNFTGHSPPGNVGGPPGDYLARSPPPSALNEKANSSGWTKPNLNWVP
ncbi:hypothetical protein DIPPA_24067 [Diplonema papillatum]|nr:hypothetical protein DIPPA_24067 [Diplonema papillatum]